MKGIPAFLMLLCHLSGIGQIYCDYKFDHIWIMGDMDTDTITTDIYGGSEINFNNSPPTYALHPKSAGISLQNATMSSKEGELIFYSNGCSVFNKLDEIMENGDSLNPGEAYELSCPLSGYVGYQNMISLPDSYNDSIFYLFHISLQFNPKPFPLIVVQSQYLYYTKINIYLNSGIGKVLEKNIPIITDTNMIATPLTAVRHANGLDWWLITPDRWGNAFNLVLLNSTGPQNLGKQFIGANTSPFAEGGQGKFSPKGDRFAWYHPENGLFLYKFNRENGELSNFEHIDIPYGDFITGGCEFSPNGRFLYICHDTSVFQLDLMEENIQTSLTHIADYDGFGDPLPTVFFFMEGTPDGKIIVNVKNGSQFLHIIQEPEKKGAECRFEQHAIKLPTINNFTLPHFPNYRMGAIEDSLCDSMMVSIADPLNNYLDKFLVRPNPASEFVLFESKYSNWSEEIRIQIIDVNGQILINTNQNYIDVGSFPNGIYFYRIVERNKLNQQGKLIIAKIN